jgi:iron(III) transport system permease protein
MVLTFVVMMKEYSPAIFLGSADTAVIGTTMLELWVQGNTGSVAALATIQIAITAVFVGVAGLLMKGKKDA